MPMGEQVTVQIDDEQLREVDRLVHAGVFPDRAAVVLSGLALLLREQRRRAIVELYRLGYSRHCQSGDDLVWVETAGRAGLVEME